MLFTASVDPFGTNPSESCQIFSIDRLGTELRQITTFNEGAAPSATGCGFREDAYLQPPPECTVGDLRQDEATRAVLFTSTCDVFGDNPYGEQLFAMNPDGTALRQLTHTRGFTEIDGTVDVELPGPFASSAQPRVGAGLKPAPTSCRPTLPAVPYSRRNRRIRSRNRHKSASPSPVKLVPMLAMMKWRQPASASGATSAPISAGLPA